MKTTSITRELHHKIMGLAQILQNGMENGSTWEALSRVEDELAKIINEEAARLAGSVRQPAYYETLEGPTTPSKYATVTITRDAHSRVAAVAARRDEPMGRIVCELIETNL